MVHTCCCIPNADGAGNGVKRALNSLGSATDEAFASLPRQKHHVYVEVLCVIGQDPFCVGNCCPKDLQHDPETFDVIDIQMPVVPFEVVCSLSADVSRCLPTSISMLLDQKRHAVSVSMLRTSHRGS